jgi:putative peptidoglycan lipid II flippase
VSEPAEAGGKLARRAGIVAIGTLASRVLGLGRDAVFAASFPAAATDLFFVAFTIPNALRALLGEGAVTSAVVPVFSEVREEEGLEAAKRFHARVTGVLGLILLAVSILGSLAAPLLTLPYAAGFAPERFDDTVTLTRVVFPYLFFAGVAALGMGGLNSLRRFAVPAFAPAMLNVAFIAAPFLLAAPAAYLGLPPVGALALGALVGGALVVLAQVPALHRAGLLRWPRPALDPRVREVVRRMLPLLAGLGVYQLNVMLGRLLATYLAPGSPTYLYFGQRLVELPQGMLALAIAGAALPTLSDLVARDARPELERVFGQALRLTLFLAIPATVGLAVLAEPLIRALIGRGHYGEHEIAETAASLTVQALGVWAIASVRVLVPLFYAHRDTRSPVIASAVNLVVFAAVGLGTMGPLAHVGLALALSVAGFAQMAALLVLLRWRVGSLGLGAVVRSALRSAAAAAAMGGALWGFGQLAPPAFLRALGGLPYLGCAVVLGAVVYFAAVRALGASELAEMRQAVRKRRVR